MSSNARRSALMVVMLIGGLVLFSAGFLVALTVRSVVAGPEASPGGPVPTPVGHAWVELQDHGVSGSDYWLGTTGNGALELRVNATRALRLEPNGESPNVIGGYSGNSVTVGVVGAAIGGGGSSGKTNRVTDIYGTIGGGRYNQAGDGAGTTLDRESATVGGGLYNRASGGYATIAGGYDNIASGLYSTVGGGWAQHVTGENATVAGGWLNYSTALYSTVGGGMQNTASAQSTTVAGGEGNGATGQYSTVGGGMQNTASAQSTTVAGGESNGATGLYSTVAGGRASTAGGAYTTVGGGWNNQAPYHGGTVGGGADNRVFGMFATVGGGVGNWSEFNEGTIAGGSQNYAGAVAAVGGGSENVARGDYATVSGGTGNLAAEQASTVGGGQGNEASEENATIGGGYHNLVSLLSYAGTVGGGQGNTTYSDSATIGGGNGNTVSGLNGTVGGGYSNVASNGYATVGGGYSNVASGSYATVPGGSENTASGNYSFAAGWRAKAYNQGCFVWADSNSVSAYLTCPIDNAFIARASGGVHLYTSGDLSTGAYLQPGSSSWSSVSDRNVKDNFTPVDGQEVLASLANVPITTWNLKSQDEAIRHMGPVAQDFYAAFGLGEDERYISTVDVDGVALAAIQGLYELSQEQAARIQVLEEENAELKQQLGDLEARVTALEGGAATSGASAGPLSGFTAGWLTLGGLVVLGGLILVQRRRTGGER